MESRRHRLSRLRSARGVTADENTAKSATDVVAERRRPRVRRPARRGSRTSSSDGDTLGSIADSLDLDGGWRALYAENKDAIGADPSDIAPGQTLDTGAH